MASINNFRLDHWDERRLEFLNMDIKAGRTRVEITVLNDESGEPREVALETRDNGTLAVLIYGRGEDEPRIILLPARGGLIEQEA